MNFLKEGKTNWKFILIVVILAVIIGGGILGYQILMAPKEEVGVPEEKVPGEVTKDETAKDIEKYLHPDAILRGVEMPPEAEYQVISVEKAISFAIQHLENKGVKEIQICETDWMVTPLGGFLIDGKGDFSVGEKHYSIFRIGVRDGSEGNAGDEFVFIARGDDGKGGAIWYPEPGPDFRPAEGEVFPEELLAYEFLGDREKFESLSSRFK